MPTRARSFGRSVLGSPTETPSTRMRPLRKLSSPLTHLISVDLPDPDGPHTTTTSPRCIVRLQSLRTCAAPYHLSTASTVIMAEAPLLRPACSPAAPIEGRAKKILKLKSPPPTKKPLHSRLPL